MGRDHITLDIYDIRDFWPPSTIKGVHCHRFHNSACFMIMYDITRKSTFDHVEKWLAFIQDISSNPQAIKILIGCKCDLSDQRQISTKAGASLANKNGLLFMEISRHFSNLGHLVFGFAAAAIGSRVRLHRENQNPLLVDGYIRTVCNCKPVYDVSDLIMQWMDFFHVDTTYGIGSNSSTRMRLMRPGRIE